MYAKHVEYVSKERYPTVGVWVVMMVMVVVMVVMMMG